MVLTLKAWTAWAAGSATNRAVLGCPRPCRWGRCRLQVPGRRETGCRPSTHRFWGCGGWESETCLFREGRVGVRAENREFSCEKSDQVIYLGPIAREENSRFCARTTPCGVSIERVTNASRTVLELHRLDSSDRAPLYRDHGYDDERFLTLCVPAE